MLYYLPMRLDNQPAPMNNTERRAVKDVDFAAIPLFVAARHLWWLASQIKIAPTVGYSRLHSLGFFKRAVDFLEEWERSELVEYRM